ncbi:MFS general substrate transporter [Westerdykella ornata]|uniref:MFS general substrate transporter n=1 Tax=Westerdykella ornata TaxID=318751 RepID=A0A6A6JXH7_WESOR|nr:MFS general substrate transporter [Westerdykella ornata]KAF2280518.1 MFS general substrate transporter [Westerdykella ornata]
MALGILEPKSTSTPPPGTELLVEDEHSAGGHAGLKHAGKNNDIILVPQPSDDPNDPLLWPRWKKEASFAFLFFNCIIFAACPGPMIAPATVALAQELDVPVKKIAQLSGYQLLIVGAMGPLVSVLAQKFGKRPQFLFAAFSGLLGTCICISSFSHHHSLSKAYTILLAGRMVQGLGTTAFESLSVAAIGDMFFLHERGLRTALLVLTLACLSSFVAIIAGVGFETLGARNLFVMLAPIQGFGTLGAVLFMPESQFKREEEGRGMVEIAEAQVGGEKETGGFMSESAVGSSSNTPTTPKTAVQKKRSFVQDLRVTSGSYNGEGVGKLLAEIFVHLLNPAVIWIQLVSAVLVSFFVGTAYTLAQTFTPPPYRLTVSQNGYFFTGALIGGLLGVAAGPLCDFSARTLARRNRGIYEPEFRIPVCVVAVCVFALGWFLFGWAVDEGGKGGLAPGTVVKVASFCYGAVGLGTSVASTSGGLYILDAFRPFSTQIFILQMMIKNFLFYAFSTFINEFAAERGPGHMCRVFGIVTVCGFSTCVPMYVFGKVNRVWVHGMWRRYLGGK